MNPSFPAEVINLELITHRSYHLMVLLLLCFFPMILSPHSVWAQRVMVQDGLPQARFLTSPVHAVNPRNGAGEFFITAVGGVRENPVSEEIFAKVRFNGEVRVIVQLRIPAEPDETRDQRIDAARQGLLRELVPVAYRVVRSYTAISALALESSHAALQVLNPSFHVLRADEDELAAPFIKPGPLAPSVNGVRDRERE